MIIKASLDSPQRGSHPAFHPVDPVHPCSRLPPVFLCCSGALR